MADVRRVAEKDAKMRIWTLEDWMIWISDKPWRWVAASVALTAIGLLALWVA